MITFKFFHEKKNNKQIHYVIINIMLRKTTWKTLFYSQETWYMYM